MGRYRWGLTAYNAALLVCEYASRKPAVHVPQIAEERREGKMDPRVTQKGASLLGF
jgi:hypothetical protein